MHPSLPLIHRFQPDVERARAPGNGTSAPLTHAEALQAVAKLNNARSWDDLPSAPTLPWRLFGRSRAWKPSCVVHLDELLFNLSLSKTHLGTTPNLLEQVSQEMYWSRRHLLLVGPNGKGASATVEYLAGQQLARGGGLLILDTAPDDAAPVLLQKIATACGRSDFQLYALKDEPNEPSPKIALLAKSAGAAYVRLPYPSPKAAMQYIAEQFVEKLDEVGSALREARRGTDLPPFMVVLPDGGWLLTDAWRSLLQNARAFGIQFVFRLHNMADLRHLDPSVADSVLNFETKMFWQPASPQAGEDAAKVLARSADPEKLMNTFDQLMSLELGRALVTQGGEPEQVRSCLLSATTRAEHKASWPS